VRAHPAQAELFSSLVDVPVVDVRDESPVEHANEQANVPLEEPVEPTVIVRTSTRRRKTVAAHWEGDTIVVVVPHRLPRRERQAFADELSARLIKSRARSRPTDAALRDRAIALSKRHLDGRAKPTSVTWSSRQGQRWASCTAADGTIRVSDRLRDVPGWVLDAVLVHELAHLLHNDHGPEFRALAERHPRSAEADVFLAGYSLGLERSNREGDVSCP
jgi:predicted metal-dependent hydrolase